MVGRNYLVFVALAVAAHAAITPTTRDHVITVNGKLADPANYLQNFGAGAVDPTRINGLDSAIVYTPSKDGQMSAAFQNNLAKLDVVIRYASRANYGLALALPNGECVAAQIDPLYQLAFHTAAPAPGTDPATTVVTFDIPTSGTLDAVGGLNFWNARNLDIELGSRKICLRNFGAVIPVGGVLQYKWTGATLKSVFDCAATTGGCSRFTLTRITELDVNVQQALSTSVRTVCCQSSVTSVVPAAWRIGVCINPNVQTCCGANPAGPANSLAGPVINKCCSTNTELLVDDTNACPCRSENTQATPAGGVRGVNSDCTGTNARCCLPDPSRYPELSTTLAGTTESIIVAGVWGSCYDTTISSWKCCSSGQLYNDGTHRCCPIGGVQPLDIPCSCSTDSQCDSDKRCCTATYPDRPHPIESDRCNVYQSYPYNPSYTQGRNFGALPITIQANGIAQQVGATYTQNCYGVCISPNFQSCCNGVVCQRAYEKCCNSTCCNKFSETCIEGTRNPGANSQFNGNNFRTSFYTCSSVELLTVLKSGMIYIMPLCLLIATLTGLGVVLVFANKASNRSYSFIETAMIVLALVSALASVPLFFSPMFKYGVFIIIACLFGILSAAARVQIVNIFAIIAQIIILFYIFDPIHGNRFLTFTSFRNLVGPNAGFPDTETKGLLHTTTSMFYRNGVIDTSFCTTFYDWFQLDSNARDTVRFDNPAINTFGYCKRGWVAFLLIFEGILIVAFVLLFIVSLISLLLRFRKAVNLAPITLEILKEEDAPFNPVPLY